MKLTGIIFNTSYIVAVIKLIYYIMKKIETNIKKYAVKYKKIHAKRQLDRVSIDGDIPFFPGLI